MKKDAQKLAIQIMVKNGFPFSFDTIDRMTAEIQKAFKK